MKDVAGRTMRDAMRSRKITLEESIVRLASETGASPSFVEKVRALFLGRGIDLEDSSEPYAAALSEAFRRHATIRERIDEARESLVRLHSNISEMSEVFQSHLSRLRGLRDRTAPPAEKMRLIRGENDRPLVPGPEELQ
jgi:uncharacterized coiled-coil DUF342 family protein